MSNEQVIGLHCALRKESLTRFEELLFKTWILHVLKKKFIT